MRSATRLRLTSRNFPAEVVRENIWENCGSRPGVVPAMRPIDAVGAIAIKVALRIPVRTLARSASQSIRVVRSTSTGMPRSRSRTAKVSTGTIPRDHPDPSNIGYAPRSAARSAEVSIACQLMNSTTRSTISHASGES